MLLLLADTLLPISSAAAVPSLRSRGELAVPDSVGKSFGIWGTDLDKGRMETLPRVTPPSLGVSD